jgi:hypothetical protein
MFTLEDYKDIYDAIEIKIVNDTVSFDENNLRGPNLRKILFPTVNFYPKQAEIFDYIFDQLNDTEEYNFDAQNDIVIKVQIIGAYGVGKSRLLACIMIAYLVYIAVKNSSQKFSSAVFAGSARQLREVVWSEVQYVLSYSPIKDNFICKKTALENIDNKQIRLVPTTWHKGRQDSIQGIHGTNLGIFFDEGTAIDDWVYDKAVRFCTGGKCLWLVCGNATTTGSEYYVISKLPSWKVFRWTRADNYGGKDDKFEIGLRERYGTDSDAYRVAVLAEFPKSSSNSLVPDYYLDIAATRRRLNSQRPLIMSVDIATGSVPPAMRKKGIEVPQGDESGILIANHSGHIDEYIKVQPLLDFQKVVYEWFTHYQPTYIVIDRTGVGHQFYLEMHRALHGKINKFGEPIIVIPFISEESPTYDKGMRDSRTECAFAMAEWLRATGYYPDSKEFREECRQLTTYDIGNVTKLISKDKMTKSPTRVDLLLMCFHPLIIHRSNLQYQSRQSASNIRPR